MKKTVISIFIIMFTICVNAQVIQIKKNIVAKILDKIITKQDVVKRSIKYSISFDVALEEIVEFELLYLAAKIELQEPDMKAIDEHIQNDKKYYAAQFIKDESAITNLEFLNAAGIGNGTMSEYVEYTKKQIMVSEYLNKLYEEVVNNSSYISSNEIAEYVKSHPERFIKNEKYEIMMIYFSYFDKQGNLLSDDKIKQKVKKAAECLDELKKGANFSGVAMKYSDDSLSLRTNPPGLIGSIEKNDEYMFKRFSTDIMDAFATEKIGVLHKIFGTDNGLYIFKIVNREPEKVIEGSEAASIAQNILISDTIEKKRKEVRIQKIAEFKKLFDVKLY
ncbi:MAG: hypothetical protein A2015_06910 [Spirochaetes bacterium GWF1_31_7]|nr:MAG: hypothetical protein A2Y30_09550 [Spirochaetes bacterium GWE1_32_154]OHD46560.1 MAG: hypothetical protein A2015_06910 [Spirochaetes bacterium GWF1_31_7]OHD49369.1 MAG: hypothetical protein A2Y29_03905 [Spirochaetes bacterium GWE2_31_10]OHD83354.1 MAG: hypothetical protein A2355_10100 [Spirochaetes bacterium RIFOXYB1_FULL_32_8]